MSVKYPNYVNLTSSSEEQPNERTPSPPPRKKSLSPPQAPSKSISSKSTHYTSLSSPSFRRLNKLDLDTMSFDDLYNNFKIVEQEVKGTANSSSSSSSQNTAFVSSPSSTNEVNTAYGVSTNNIQVSTASTQVSTASTQVSTANLSDATIFPTISKIEFVRPQQQEKSVRKPVNFDHVQANYNYPQRERVVSRSNYTRLNYNYSAKKAHPNAHRNMVPGAVLMKTGLRPLNTARPVNTAHPKTTVYSARPMSHFSKSAQSTVKRPYQMRTTLTNKKFSQKVNTAKGKFYTTRPKAVNNARPNKAIVNAIRANQTLKNLMEDMLPLGDEPKEEELLVKELLKLMCDKKNSVLFTNAGCFVMSPDFKLTDESRVLLKVPRKNNMYSVDMKNIVPKECLTCLVAKAILDESMLWENNTKPPIENLVNKKVKIIRCDNGTEFKNRVMSEFCEMKGIKREFSVARTPQIRCHVTILNTLNHLGKFDGKSDDGFFVGYLLNSKAFRVYNIRTRKVEKNFHVRFLEDKPIIASDGPKWLFDIDVLTESMNYVPVVADYILMPLQKDGSLFDSSSKNASNDEPQPSSDARKKDDKIITASLEATHADFFGYETELDMSNISTTYQVPSTSITRIHKDHSLDNVIGDVLSSVQTIRMTKTTNEQGFISTVYEGKTHEDFHTCLFACFLSQEEPKRIAKALMDLPKGKRAISTKWIFKNKKDERGIVIRNKARLVAHGYTQEESIDYNEVFTPIARIKAIRMFLAYDSIIRFMVYQMDVKSAFLYGIIKYEVYVCQPPGFEDPDYPDKVYKVVKALYGLHQAPRA
ncbi:putative ribonuclease H-like domain-containing protein [Tanacetum coccineum]|uniref:Ribonuclease H-like domain-containing protein n=1 Tax=Tanacetum coccineum TaxID=301880 RepID=A0ABQ5FFV4_9ASTR